MKRVFSDQELRFIKEHYQEMTYKELTDKLNQFNSIKKTAKQVRTKASVLGLSKQKHSYNRSYFERIDSAEKAYWLGFIFADGYIIRNVFPNGQSSSEVSIELNSKDEDHLEKFENALNNTPNILHRIAKDRYIDGVFVKGGTLMSQVRYYSSKMYFDLMNKGVVQNKTYRPEFPRVSGDYFLSFLLGVIDGDGYIVPDRNCVIGIVNSNAEFLKYVKKQLASYNVGSNIYQEEEWKYRLTILEKDSKRLADMMYSVTPIYLERKYRKYIEYCQQTA